jgi:small-conductance mechanosensitive channel
MRFPVLSISFLFWLVLPPAPIGAQGSAPQTQQAADTGFPVVHRGREVFRIRQGVGNLDAAERAQLMSDRLYRLVDDLSFDPARIDVTDGETFSELVYDDRVLSVITDEDAEVAGLSRPELARRVRDRVVDVVTTSREEYSASAIAIGLGWTGLATLLLVCLLWQVRRLHRRVQMRAAAWYQRLTADRSAGRVTARKTRLGAMVYSAVHSASIALSTALVVVWVRVVLEVLPWSHPLAQLLYRYVSAPLRMLWNAFVGFVPNLFFLAVIALTLFVLLRIVHVVFREIGDGNIRFASFPEEWAEPTFKLVRVLLLAVALVAAFPYVPGSRSPAFQGISLFLGLLFSLASSSALANIIAGVTLTYTRAFRLGDVVRIGETFGTVSDKRLLVTRVHTYKGVTVSVPNSLFMSTQVLNYTTLCAERRLIAHTSVTMGYEVPWRKVHELLIAAARRTEGLLDEPAPFVLQTALNDFSVSYEINAIADSPLRFPYIYSALHANIQECFGEAGLEITSPSYLALRDGNRATVPDAYLPRDYQPPAFDVRVRNERDDGGSGAMSMARRTAGRRG